MDAPDRDSFEDSPLRRALVSLVALKIAGLILVVDVAGLQAFDLPKSQYSRALEWLIVALLAAAVLRHGWGVIPRSPLHWPVAAYLGVSVLATAFAADRYVAFFGDWERYSGLTFTLDMAILYLAVACAFRRAQDWRLLGTVLGVATVLALAYALVQRAGADPIAWTSRSDQRPFSTFGQPDHFGHFLSLTFGLTVGLAAFARPPSVRVLGAIGALAVVATAAFVATRGTLLGMAAVLGVLVATPLLRRGLSVRVALIVVMLAVLAPILLLSPLGDRVRTEGMVDRTRLVLFEGAAGAFLARPLLGYGPDNFGVAFPSHRPARSADIIGEVGVNAAHDWVLQTAATAGILGLVALVAAILTATALAAMRPSSIVSGGE